MAGALRMRERFGYIQLWKRSMIDGVVVKSWGKAPAGSIDSFAIPFALDQPNASWDATFPFFLKTDA
jgi:hypothetical protein